ncbi:bifunctional DNA-formamidopyrimidine glycosylase/DNA-(apurinic or apyrimidinic site) lyase [Candidatus Falkowbacteria bacterium]|nr:bifunctional DNA-formamidopyrimidine glycosylase/DNA-(apurinic or apyrimidinic site) lyase [Candidatus Falkowbacteria bacterium]
MPELPEVETIVRDLHGFLAGQKISGFQIKNPLAGRSNGQLNLGLPEFKSRITGQSVKKVSRRAKTLVFELDQDYLLIHLKMTGQLVYQSCRKEACDTVAGGHPIVGVGNELPNKFTRAVLDFADGSHLYFNDVRRFGWLRLVSSDEWLAYEKSLGLEPLEKGFTLDYFSKSISKKKNSTIKQAILEQKYFVGVGNIYADESLFASKIKPARKVSSLSADEVKSLWLAIPKILKSAIKHRGTSFNDYRDARGKRGNFVKMLKVYGRSGQPCTICGQTLSKARIGGRGTVWCDHCQV